MHVADQGLSLLRRSAVKRIKVKHRSLVFEFGLPIIVYNYSYNEIYNYVRG